MRISKMIPQTEIIQSKCDVVLATQQTLVFDLINSSAFLDWVRRYLGTADPVKVSYDAEAYYTFHPDYAYAIIRPHGVKEAIKEIRNAGNSGLLENR
jgi:hypothetical protein